MPLPAAKEELTVTGLLLERIESIAIDTRLMSNSLGTAIGDIRLDLGMIKEKLGALARDIEGGEKPLPLRVENMETRLKAIEDSSRELIQKGNRIWFSVVNSFAFPIVVALVTWLLVRSFGGKDAS